MNDAKLLSLRILKNDVVDGIIYYEKYTNIGTFGSHCLDHSIKYGDLVEIDNCIGIICYFNRFYLVAKTFLPINSENITKVTVMKIEDILMYEMQKYDYISFNNLGHVNTYMRMDKPKLLEIILNLDAYSDLQLEEIFLKYQSMDKNISFNFFIQQEFEKRYKFHRYSEMKNILLKNE